jgi:predicted anti-sigma-YlaC factor YlaD
MTDGCLATDALVDFVEGRADREIRAQVEQHASRCEACRQVLSWLARSCTPPAARVETDAGSREGPSGT